MSEIANGDEPEGRSHWGFPSRFGLRVFERQREGCNGRAKRLPLASRVVAQHTACYRKITGN
jgi:hypothetical protein